MVPLDIQWTFNHSTLMPLVRHIIRLHLFTRPVLFPMARKRLLDAWNGYHSVPICQEDKHLTTFITPWSRYRYKTAPQGYYASGDGYTRRYELVSDIPNKTKCVDDVLHQ